MDIFLKFLSDNKDAITSLGILLTLIVSCISLYFSIRNNKAVHYVNAVTKSRVEWIDKLRNNVSRFISLTDVKELKVKFLTPKEMLNNNFKNNLKNNLKELNQVGSEILLMLNYSDEFDNKIMKMIKRQAHNIENLYYKTLTQSKISYKENNSFYVQDNEIQSLEEEIEKLNEEIIKEFQIYLKFEWNRVKKESKGKRYFKFKQEYDLEELIDKQKGV